MATKKKTPPKKGGGGTTRRIKLEELKAMGGTTRTIPNPSVVAKISAKLDPSGDVVIITLS